MGGSADMHFGHMQRGYCWSGASVDLDHYLDTWLERIVGTGQIPRKEGGGVLGNMLLGHLQRGFWWSGASVDLDHSLDSWFERIVGTGQTQRKGWDDFGGWWEGEGFVAPSARREFDRHFTNTARSYASPRP